MNDRSRTKAEVVPVAKTDDIRLVSKTGNQGGRIGSDGLGISSGQREKLSNILGGDNVSQLNERSRPSARINPTSQIGTPIVRRTSNGGIKTRARIENIGIHAPKVVALIFSIMWLSLFMILIALAVVGWR